jgi:Ca2+-binding RTX toxin-like protein
VLTLSGTASLESYQAALRSVTYGNTSEDPSAAQRIITFSIDANTAVSTAVQVIPVNDDPFLAPLVLSATSIQEGGSISLAGSFGDVDQSATYTVVVEWGDGASSTLELSDGAYDFMGISHTYLNNQAGQPGYTVSVTVLDAEGGSATATTQVSVENVAPVLEGGSVSVTGSAVRPGEAGQPVQLSGAFGDLGTLDLHSITIDWGDGSTTSSAAQASHFSTLQISGGGSGSFTAGHVYATGGIFQIAVIVADHDGGSATAAVSSWITGVRVDPATGELQVIGSAGRDQVQLLNGAEESSAAQTVKVKARFDKGTTAETATEVLIPTLHVKSVFIALGDGDDRAIISRQITIGATVLGGAGDDHITTAAGNDILAGGAGSDKLIPGEGNNLLIGGSGADDLKSGSSSKTERGDILIGGHTAHDTDVSAMRMIMAQWSTPGSHEDGVAELTRLGGLLDLSNSVFTDEWKDSLTSDGHSRDLLLAKASGEDRIKARSGATVLAIARLVAAA